MSILQNLFGLCMLITLAWTISEQRHRFPWRIVFAGLLMQFVLATVLLKAPLFKELFVSLNQLLRSLEKATEAGTSFVFGFLGGGPLPFEETQPGASFVFAFRALPLVLVVSAMSSLLFYWRILPLVIRAFSKLLQKSMGIGGALGVVAAANIFVGMVEAPLLVRPYLARMSRAELFALMTTGMATIAGTMMVLYGSILSAVNPDALGHVLIASIISAPAAIMIASIMVPMNDEGTVEGFVPIQEADSSMDAITKGTLQGVQLLINIIAMLIVFVALVSLANMLLDVLPNVRGEPLTLQRLSGYVLAPLMWLMGIPLNEVLTAGSLMGSKTILNEFIAYVELTRLPAGALSERSQIIMIYAMCGFANLGSLGIMVGGIGTMAPERRAEIIGLGMKSILAGALATMTTGAVVGLLIR